LLQLCLLGKNLVLVSYALFHLAFLRSGFAHHHGSPALIAYLWVQCTVCLAAPFVNVLVLRGVGVPRPGRFVELRRRLLLVFAAARIDLPQSWWLMK